MRDDDTDDETEEWPNWVASVETRTTPFSEEELDVLVEGFIRGLDEDEWQAFQQQYGGEEATRARIRAGFIKLDENNLVNMTPEGPVH